MNRHLTEEEFAAYIEGRVSEEERRQIEIHLSCCDKCLDELGELVEIWKKRTPVPVEFIRKARGEKSLRKKRWTMQLVPAAALVLLALLLGYQVFFRAGKNLQISEQAAPPVADIKAQPVAAKPIEESEPATVAYEFSSSKKMTGELKAKIEEDRKQTLPPTVQVAKKGEYQDQTRYLKEEMQRQKDEEQRRFEEERKRAMASSAHVPPGNQQNIQNNRTIQVSLQGRATDNVQSKGTPEKKSIQPPGVNWRLEGDATAADLLNPEILDSLASDKSPLENPVLLLEVDAGGKVVKVKAGAPPGDKKDGTNVLVSQVEKLLFSPSEKEVREIKLVFLKKQGPDQESF